MKKLSKEDEKYLIEVYHLFKKYRRPYRDDYYLVYSTSYVPYLVRQVDEDNYEILPCYDDI